MDDKAQQILQLAQFHAHVLDGIRQTELLRMWREELDRPRYAEPKRLLRYGFKVYSQNDEDGIIQEIFNRIGTTNRVFVEFGVENGMECNTAKLLIDGWRGLWLEGSPQYVAEIRNSLTGFLDDRCLQVQQTIVTAENINALVEQAGITGDIDLLSIDIDYNDYWVWKAISAVSPRVVVVEYNATLRPPLSLTVPYDPSKSWDGTNYFGASLEALVRLGRDKGYRIVGCNFSGSNAFFVREDLTSDHFHEPATAEEHYEPARFVFSLLMSGHRPRVAPYVAV